MRWWACGQLVLLASATLAARVDGLVLIAAGTAHWRVWPAGQRWRAWATVQVIRAVDERARPAEAMTFRASNSTLHEVLPIERMRPRASM